MKTHIKTSTGILLTSSIVLGGIASAAITAIPSFSGPSIPPTPTAAPIISESDLYDSLIRSINILDARTNGTQSFDAGSKSIVNVANPLHSSDAANKHYVDTQISQQKIWESVSLKTANNFDPKCKYLITTGKNSFLATSVEANELKYYEAWGAGEYLAAWISPLKKSIIHMDVSHFYDDVIKTSDEKVVKLEKNCSL